jgi:hypothetical protein
MRRSTLPIVAVLLALPAAMPLCAQPPASSAAVQSGGTAVRIESLSDTRGLQLGPYLSTFVPELRRRFTEKAGAADGGTSMPQQEAIVVLTISPGGELSALRLESEAQGSPIAQAAWNAANNTAYAPLPTALNDSTLTLRVHFIQ